MIIYLGSVRADVREWEERLEAETATPGGIVVLGEDAYDGSPFLTVRLERLGDPRSTFTFGVGGGSLPVTPALLGRLWGGLVWLGAGRAVHAIDPRTGSVAEHAFESPFMECFVPTAGGVLVVAYESGLCAFGPDGAVLWQISTDLVEDLRWSDDTVVVEQMDAPAVEVRLTTGEILPKADA